MSSNFKIFLWDQFIRPFYMLFNVHQLKAILLAIVIINAAYWKSLFFFWIPIFILSAIFSKEIYNYWKSGEYMHNYRKYKYPEYRKVTKELKKNERWKEETTPLLSS